MSDAQEMLKRMRTAKDAEKKPRTPVNPEDLKVRILISVQRRRQLVFLLLLALFTFMAILAKDMSLAKPWWLTSLPIIGLGLIICLIPSTEEWEYKPWQTRARQYEKHQLER